VVAAGRRVPLEWMLLVGWAAAGLILAKSPRMTNGE
jgi:hypothetical protein